MGLDALGRALVRAAAACLAALAAWPAEAGCRLALALGLDVSNSVDPADYALQRDGLVAALGDAEVRAAMLEGGGEVALAVYEWGGRGWQELRIDWRAVTDAAALDAVRAEIAAFEKPPDWQPTAIGAALSFARGLFARAPDCAAYTLDLSGDGQNNDGPTPARIYGNADFGPVTVNGLAIAEHESDILRYYAREVIRGPGAFVEPAARHADFPEAIRRKLLRELQGPVLGRAGGSPGGAG